MPNPLTDHDDESDLDRAQTHGHQDSNRDLPRAGQDSAGEDTPGEDSAEDTRRDGRHAAGQDGGIAVKTPPRSNRGFAAMAPEERRAIASRGGQSQGKQNNPGNFANNRERAREAGRKGGQH
jgi:general stress protein YciG